MGPEENAIRSQNHGTYSTSTVQSEHKGNTYTD